MNTDDRESKCVRFAESQSQKRQGEDVEELAANAEEQHLDADVEVRAHKTYRVEDVAGGCGSRSARTDADGGKVSCASSKTEMFEKIEESLRQCKGVECVRDHSNAHSVEIRVASRLGLREGGSQWS